MSSCEQLGLASHVYMPGLGNQHVRTFVVT